jgi:hypothetical protein
MGSRSPASGTSWGQTKSAVSGKVWTDEKFTSLYANCAPISQQKLFSKLSVCPSQGPLPRPPRSPKKPSPKKRGLCTATDNGGTSIRPDKRNTWHPQIPLTRPVERDIRVEAHLRDPQSSQTISPSHDSGTRLTASTEPRRFRISHTAQTLFTRS